jgi:class 3 adenylate cyclase/DNA-binding winged helix-turn-helix (wHTH) protein/tetratricopeptide (TPR) repeat protein
MIYRFADCALDTHLYTLDRAGQRIRLSPKVFEVLCYLLEHRDRVVSKQELCAQVWQGTTISDAALESCLRMVRTSVGDSGQGQRIIQTQRGYGYRFVADLERLPEAMAPSALPPVATPSPRPVPPERVNVSPCAACHATNPAEATFCAACGTRLRPRCPHCGQTLLLPSACCTACEKSSIVPSSPATGAGRPQSLALPPSPVIPPDQRGVGPERKLVTVMCCTMARTGAGMACVDLATLYRRMQELHTLAHAVAHPYEGRLHAALGDRLLIVFGVPDVHEDDAHRAVRVALDLQRRWQGHQELLGTGSSAALTLRMGLHTGVMVVGDRQDGAAFSPLVGDVVAVAMGLQEHAAPGQILCSDATARLVQRTVRLAAVDPVELPEQPAPVTTYAVLRHRGRRAPGWERWGRVLSPFVGRERECTTLHALLAQAETGRGQVVGIVGEPGIGKSRLLYEFRQSLEGKRLTYLTGRCLSYGSTTPYLPILHILRHNCGILESDSPEDITAKVHRALQEAAMAPAAWAPVLLHLLGVQEEPDAFATLSPEARKARTVAAGLQMCLHGSRRQPLILEIEDLHWIDASSDECLAALVERMAGAAILVLVTYRPGYRPPWVDKSYTTQVALPPLTPPDSWRLVQAVLPAAVQATPLVSQVLAKAAGNPFFLEELALTVVEQGVGVSSATVPDTVQAVLTARIDRLPASAKHLLQAAAVMGMEVPLPLLQAIAELPEAALHRDLTHLQATEFLYETRLSPETAYTFKHALTQQVAYELLLQERRRVLHARIVTALETLAGDRMAEGASWRSPDQVEHLAHHALRGEVWGKALTYGRQAGEKALARSAHREAVGYFEQALSALSQLPEQRATCEQAIDLRLALRTALLPSGDFARILAVLHEAEALATTLDNPQRLTQVSGFLSRHFSFMGAHDQAIAAAQRVLVLATTSGDVVLHALANFYLGIGYWDLGDYRRAIDCHTQTMASLDEGWRRERFGLIFLPAVDSRATLAHCYAELGMFAEGRAFGEEGLQLAEAAAHPASLMWASYGIGLLSLRQGDLPRALPLLERAVGICQDADLPAWSLWMAATLSAAYTLAGRVAEAVPLLTQAMAQIAETGMVIDQTRCRLALGEAQLLAGHLEEAQALAEQAQALARARQERGNQAYALRLLGDRTARHEPPENAPAEAHYQQALARAEELGMRPLQAHCHLGLGILYATIGQREQAGAQLSTAIKMYRTMEMTFWLPQAEAALAQVEGP